MKRKGFRSKEQTQGSITTWTAWENHTLGGSNIYTTTLFVESMIFETDRKLIFILETSPIGEGTEGGIETIELNENSIKSLAAHLSEIVNRKE